MARKAVVLVSGGLDSTTCLALAVEQGFAPIALSFEYGQRHDLELRAARRVAAHYGADPHLVVELGLFRKIGGSALTTDLPVPMDRPLDEGGIPTTYVPARNLVFLSMALGVAEVHGADDLFVGVNALDYSGYPDCRPEFVDQFERTANLAVRAAVEGRRFRVRAPLLHLSKADIVREGARLGVPWELTWSCYAPAGDRACGRCDACRLRLRGFAEAGHADPIPYATRGEG